MTDLASTLRIEADASGVETGVAAAKRSLSSLGGAAAQAGQDGANGLGKIGAGAAESSKKIESATKNTISSIQRQIAAFEAGGTSSRQYQESLAKLRGIDTNALKPYLDQLDAARVKALAAGKANDQLGQSFGGLGSMAANAGSLLASLGLSLSIAGAATFIKRINDGVDALNDLADATGATIENISALEDVAARTGTGFDTVSTALIKMNQALNSAKEGSDAANAIKAIGLSVKELKDLDPAEAFRQVAVALSGFADDGNKARLTQELFGKSLKEVAPLLKDLAEKGELNATVTKQQADEAERFNKELFNLQKNATDAARSLTSPLVSAMNEVINKFREGSAAGKSFFAIVNDRYWENVRGAYGMDPANSGGASGSWGDAVEAPRPSVGNLPDMAKIKAGADAAKRALAEQNKELAEQAKLLAELSGLSGSFAGDWDRLNKIYASGKISVEQLTAAQAELLAKQPAMKAGHEAAAKAMREAEKAAEELTKTMEEYAKANVSGVASAVLAAQNAEAELANYGLLKSAVMELTLVHLEQSRELAAMAGEDVSNIEKRINAQKRLIAATQGIESKDVAKKTAEASEKYWDDMWKSVDSTAHDVFVNIFEDGSDAFKKLGVSLKASVIDLLYQMTVKKWIINIGASVTGGGAANATTSGGNMLSSAGSLYSTGSSAYTVGSQLFGGTMGAGNAVGTLAANAMTTGAGTALDGLLATNAAFGTVSTAAAGASTALAQLAAAAPYIAAFVGVAYLASKYASPGTSHIGGGSQYSAAGGLQTTGTYVPEQIVDGHWEPDVNGSPVWVPGSVIKAHTTGTYANETPFSTGMGTLGYDQSAVDMTTGIAQGIVGLLDATATTFGKEAGFQAATTFADDTSKDGAWGSLLISNLEGVMVNWADTQTSRWAPKEFSNGATGATEYQTAIAADVRGVLDKIGLPEWATDMLAAVGDTPDLASLGTAVAQINLVHDALSVMGDKLAGFAALSDGAVSALIAASGGFDKLAANASTYYDNFYADSEKTAFAMGEIGKTLAGVGQTVPATREAFRAQVEYLQSIADTEPAAAPALAAMLGLSGAFASIVPATEAAATATEAAAGNVTTLAGALDALRNPIRTVEDIANSIFALEGEGASLQIELLRAYGDSTSVMQANQLQREAETAGMTAQEVALYDLNVSRREEIAAIAAARQATADGIASWENYFSMFATAPEKQARAQASVSAVLGADVDTLAEYRQLVQSLTDQFGIGSAEVKRVTDVAGDFAIAFPEVATALTEVTDAAADTAQAVGFDAAGLAAMITRAAFESADVGGAAAGFAAALSDSVRNAMISSVVGDIANSIYASIITPIIAGAAVSEATTDAVIANATAQIATLSDLFASDTFAGLLDSITSAVAPTLAPIAELSEAADTAAGSVQGLTNVMEGINNAIDVSRLTHWQNLISPDALTGAETLTAGSDDPSLTVAETLTASILARVRDVSGAYRGIEVEMMAVHGFLGRVSEDAASLQNTLMNAGDTAIGQGLQLTPLIDFFTDLNVTATAISDAIAEFPDASLTYEGDWTNGMITVDGLDASTLATIGDAAGTIGATLTQAFADSISEAITTALPDVSTDILATVGGVEQGDTQSLVNAFTILSGALVDGSLTAAQYATAIDLVNDSYLNGSTDNSAVAAERTGLQQQLDLLTGVTTARELERNALDETNRALYDQVEAAQKVKDVATERTGLQQQLDLLTGVTTARGLERAAIDATNLALFDRITLAQDEITYADGFFTAAEKASVTTASMTATMAALGLTLPTTNAGFRAMVESIDLTTESGLATYTAMMGMAGEFATLHPLIDTTTESITNLAAAQKALATESAGLMDQLWVATNQTAKIRAKELAALDPSNRPLKQALYDIADAQTAFASLQTAVGAEKERLANQLDADKRALDTGSIRDAYDAQKTALQAELDLKRQGYADQISAAQSARDDIASIAGALSGAVKTVQIESEAYDRMRLNAARSTISGAASTGNIRATGLEDALGLAGQDSKQFYSSFSDYAKAQGRTAAEIARLDASAQSQLSGADATIAALRASDDVARVLADAQMAALDAQQAIDIQLAADQIAALDAQYALDLKALDDTMTAAQNQIDALMGLDTSVLTLAQAVAGLAGAIGTANTSIGAVGGVPGFATGGSFAGGLRIVGENGPELEATGPARIWNASQLNSAMNASNNAEMVAELRALREEVAALRATAERGNVEAKRGSDALQGQQRMPLLVQVVS